jgi:Derlin-2/3
MLTFKAPWLPWVLMGFAFVMHGAVPIDEICGIIVGHRKSSLCFNILISAKKICLAVWYYFNDIYPPIHHGARPLDPPSWWFRLWEDRPIEERADTEDDARPEFPIPPVRDIHNDVAR